MERGLKIGSANLQRLRNTRNWTQDQLAQKVCKSKRTIELIEENKFGYKNVYQHTARKLADALGVPLDELLWSSPEMTAEAQEPPLFASDAKLERAELRTDLAFLSVPVCGEGAQTDPIVFCCQRAQMRLHLDGISSQRDPVFQPADYVVVKVFLGTGTQPVVAFEAKPPCKVISGKVSGGFAVSQTARAVVNLTIEAQQLALASGRSTSTARRKLAKLWAEKLPSHRRRYVFEVSP